MPMTTSRVTKDEMFRRLLEAAPDAMVIISGAGTIILVNSQFEKLFGWPRTAAIGQPVELLIPQRFHPQHENHRTGYFLDPRVRPMGSHLELYGLRQDGSEFPVEISLSPLPAEQGTLAIAAIRDVTERKRIEQALREKNAELENANRAKDRFLASMSHELRTPLNAILGFTGTLLMKLPGPLTTDQDKQLHTIQTSARHLLSLINDLLDLAKIESGKVELKVEPVSCQNVLEEVTTTLRPLAEAKGLKFLVSIQDPKITLRTDRRALSQILLNLTNNAIKFTDSGTVQIELRQQPLHKKNGTQTEFSITDTGIGLKAEEQARLFQAFEQLGTSNTRRHEGTGLGLYLSQKLASLLGGRIEFESVYGQGSQFTLILER